MSLSGFLLIDKPAGITSFGVVKKVRYLLKAQKVGHAGTLDPFATGLLVCAVGEATKLIDWVQGGRKRYSGTILLGVGSDTDDITGKLRYQSIPKGITFEQIQRASCSFVGEIKQAPPAVSAIHIDGERAYQKVRRGEAVICPPRPVTVERFELSDPTMLQEGIVAGDGLVLNGQALRVSFILDCGKGTYVRSLARDLGEILGTAGCVESLRRERSEPFDLTTACSLTELEELAADASNSAPLDPVAQLPGTSSKQGIQPDRPLTPKGYSNGVFIPWHHLFSDAPAEDVTEWERERFNHGCQQALNSVVTRALDRLVYANSAGPTEILLKYKDLTSNQESEFALLACDVKGWRVVLPFRRSI